jgi:hypothetical protein
MKLKIKIFIFYIISAFFIVQIFSQCIDYPDTIDLKRSVPCPLVTENIHKRNSNENENFHLVGFDCNNATESICESVKESFYVARDLFSKTFLLNTPVLFHLNFTDICVINPEVCDPERGLITIGGAHTVREILLLDDDGISRFYPQALVKQFQFETHPEFASLDVIATFNSVIDWYFPSDIGKKEIQRGQLDLVYTILHEMVHSLGFNSNWNRWMRTDDPNQVFITPRPVVDINETDNSTIFNGFRETAFDKNIIINNNHRKLTLIAQEFNEFAKIGTKFDDVLDFIFKFADSELANLAEYMNNLTTTAKTISYSCDGVKAILDTALDPFLFGLNVDHLQQPYNTTSDFLMTTVQSRGITLDEIIELTNSKGPIGPKTQVVMECMGLATKNNPHPKYRPQLIP